MVGRTEAHSRVANMMRMIDKSGWLGQTSISSIFVAPTSKEEEENQQPVALSQFSVMFKVLNQDTPKAKSATDKQESRQ